MKSGFIVLCVTMFLWYKYVTFVSIIVLTSLVNFLDWKKGKIKKKIWKLNIICESFWPDDLFYGFVLFWKNCFLYWEKYIFNIKGDINRFSDFFNVYFLFNKIFIDEIFLLNIWKMILIFKYINIWRAFWYLDSIHKMAPLSYPLSRLFGLK